MERYDLEPDGKEKKVLDIGCGMNPDPRANMIMDLTDIGDSFPGIEFHKHDANIIPLPFEDNTFDYIIMNNIIEHLTVSDDKLFKEIYRILKIYGKVEIHCPNSLFIYHRLLYFFGWIPCDFILCHRKHYNFKQLKTNLRNAGFKVFEMNNKWVFNPLRNFLNPHIKIIAKKGG